MDQFTEKDIATLLRLKRHEQPPPAYFDNFLHEFHRRQRAELLKQPLWEIAFQRTRDFVSELTRPNLVSYPFAAAAVLICAAVLSLKVYETPVNNVSRNVAAVTTRHALPVAATLANEERWSLSTPVSTRNLGATPIRMATERAQLHRATATTPRYILDSTPVSYEASLRF